VAIPDQRRTAPRYLRRLHGLVHARFALHRIRDTQRNEGQAPVGRVHGPSRAPFGSASCNISISPTVSEVTRQEWPKSLKDRAATPQKTVNRSRTPPYSCAESVPMARPYSAPGERTGDHGGGHAMPIAESRKDQRQAPSPERSPTPTRPPPRAGRRRARSKCNRRTWHDP
jgi:hypothetical protein